MALAGQLGADVVAVGSWWQPDGSNEIDTVVLAQPARARVPVAVGEAKWARQVDAASIKSKLTAKAAVLTEDFADLRYIVCAREQLSRPDPNLLTVTAAEIFSS